MLSTALPVRHPVRAGFLVPNVKPYLQRVETVEHALNPIGQYPTSETTQNAWMSVSPNISDVKRPHDPSLAAPGFRSSRRPDVALVLRRLFARPPLCAIGPQRSDGRSRQARIKPGRLFAAVKCAAVAVGDGEEAAEQANGQAETAVNRSTALKSLGFNHRIHWIRSSNSI